MRLLNNIIADLKVFSVSMQSKGCNGYGLRIEQSDLHAGQYLVFRSHSSLPSANPSDYSRSKVSRLLEQTADRDSRYLTICEHVGLKSAIDVISRQDTPSLLKRLAAD